jgi:hypothetical protein
MMKNTTHALRANSRQFKRAALLAGGAALAGIVSVSASYSVVTMLYPRQAAPANLAATQPNAVRAVPEIILSTAPRDAGIDVTPLDSDARQVETVRAPEVAAVPAPKPDAVAPEAEVIVSTKSVSDIALPPAPEAAPSVAVADSLVADRALSAPAPRPTLDDDAAPEAFAALTAGDSAARTGATLGFAAPEADVDEPALALADPDMPAIRPQPRPGMAKPVVAAVDAAPGFADTIPGIRPQPRPEVVRVAAAVADVDVAPLAPASQAIPARSGGLFGRSGNSTCGTTLARSMPRRSSNAATGSAYFASLGGLSGSERDARVINELAQGNMPGFLHQLEPVSMRGKDARGADTEIVICVTPDYLALGSDSDFVRVPLGLPAAARIAGRFDMTLPTPRMVDAIYAQAAVKLSPSPMTPGPQMSSTAYLVRHNATIQGQLGARGGLVAGQKKDVVMASRMASAPGRVAIYGWHRSGGSPIQPVSTVHGANYADYSHGIRLVSKTAYLNGRAVSLDELLGSGQYAYLLNSDGPLPGPVIHTASR